MKIIRFILNVISFGAYVCSVWTMFILSFVFSKTIFNYVMKNIESNNPKILEYVILISVVWTMGLIINKVGVYYNKNLHIK